MWWAELISLLNKVFGIALPIIDERESRKYTDEENDRNAKWAEITGNENDHDRRNLVGAYVKQLCIDTGNPVGRISGASIEVPMEYFDSLVKGNIQLVRLRKENDLLFQTIRRESK